MSRLFVALLITLSAAPPALPQDAAGGVAATGSQDENWNLHVQSTDIVQGYAPFSAQYTNPGYNSLPPGGEARETVSLDLMAGVRLWSGAEAHVDALMWQGYGLDNTLGLEAFPSAEAYRAGTSVPNGMLARLFVRQTINLGGGAKKIDDDQLHLAGQEDSSRLTITVGRFSAIDIFDTNAYANDPRTQFMNWAFVADEAWDYPADPVGFTTGLAVELYEAGWALRWGFMQMPSVQNNWTAEDQLLKWPTESSGGDGDFWKSWGMPLELERHYSFNGHPGAVRLLAYLNEADMATYAAAVAILSSMGPRSDFRAARSYNFKYGYGINWEQEITKGVGLFSRLGWNNGQTESWAYGDVDRSVTLGLSISGEAWHRLDDTFGLAGVASGITHEHQVFFQEGGTGILGGDGALNYSWEKGLETYYDFKVWKALHAALDYQFIADPAYNRARGPISIFAVRLHWEL